MNETVSAARMRAAALSVLLLAADAALAQEKSGPLPETYEREAQSNPPSAYETPPVTMVQTTPPTIPQTTSEELAPWRPAEDGDLESPPSSDPAPAFETGIEAKAEVFERVVWAAEAYEDLINGSDSGVPEWLLAEARCVAVIPHVIKGAFFVGVRYGKGVLTCRNEFGEWSPIVFITLGGPSVGFQFGAQATDVVLYFRRERGVERLLTTKITLGGDASIAAGPAGRRASAEVDVTLTTDVLSYAHSRGIFLGVSLEGSYLGIDGVSNETFYGAPVDPRQLLFTREIEMPRGSAQKLLALLP